MTEPLPNLIIDEKPTLAGREEILRPLVDFNSGKVGDMPYGPVALYLKNDASEPAIGGLWGRFAFNWLFVELLFVPENLRGKGVGTNLMETAEGLAKKAKCTGVWLDSFSFQAPKFYLRLGYKEFGSLPCYPNTETRHFFSKRI